MKKIVISSTGTDGDHLPYIALGKALKKQGYQVIMAFRASMASYVLNAGLEHIICGQELTQEEARKKAQDWDEWQLSSQDSHGSFTMMQNFFKDDFPVIFQQLKHACRDADLLISGLQRQLFGAILEKKTGLPWVAASVTPAFQCSNLGQHTVRQQTDIIRLFLPILETVIQQLNLPSIDWFKYHENPRAILGSSRHFSETLPEYSYYQQTGFWFYEEPTWQNWQPDNVLKEFVERSPSPLFLSFSSIPVTDPQRVLNVHLQAAKALGRGLVVQRGWANFNESLLENEGDRQHVCFVDFMPQAWLLENVGAIIHHGGVGTIARALRHNCPMVVEPLGNDQFFNAKRILSLKIGTAVHPHKVTVEGLASLLEGKVLTSEVKHNTMILGEEIRSEDSLRNACNIIQNWL
ncbi:glycosyltransferase [Pantanalinema sp. GBBB05]|uniref:glycosyltransferase n=1 Tax=Pantanalinema sp. GBBB05 TaxID=2604139 RepID=UPI001D83B1B8|nr:glycosyltransferase family 1 protein [Pantanalinema sp. GBBB05]